MRCLSCEIESSTRLKLTKTLLPCYLEVIHIFSNEAYACIVQNQEVFFQWEKLGCLINPAEVTNSSWVSEYAQAPNTLVFDEFVRIFFCSRQPMDENGQYISRVGFADLEVNGKPSITQISRNAILPLGGIGNFDQFGTYPFSPLRVNNEFLAVYAGWTRSETTPFDVSLGLAHGNQDATEFARHSDGPVLTKSLNEPFVISSPKLRFFHGKYYLFYIAGKQWINNENGIDPIYTIRMAISDDAVNWKRKDKEIIAPVLEFEAQASPDVFFKDGLFHMFFCYRYGKDFRQAGRGYRMGYAYSEDLLSWHRDDARSDLRASDSGWDSESISYPHVFDFQSRTFMLYLGNNVGKTGIGIARLVTNEN